jgi:ACT domain-containing protein
MKHYRMRIVSEEKLQEDLDIAMSNIDDLSAAALNLTSGGSQAYSQFIQLRDTFRNYTLKMRDDYKPVDVLL